MYLDSLETYNAAYTSYRTDSLISIRSISPPTNGIKWRSSNSAAYLSASQGIEVHLKGLSWRGWYLDHQSPVVKTLRNNFDAQYSNTIDNIKFDPDFPSNGYPDLIVKVVNAPSFYNPGIVSEYLGELIKVEPKPYKSYELQSCDNRKATMDLWLVTCDLTFRIEPEMIHQRNGEWDYDGRHPITKEQDEWSRGRREYKNTRYDRLSVFLELKPKHNFYIAETGAYPYLQPNQNPKIGIGAVECIQIEKVGEKGINNQAVTLGVDLEKGKSLPLYPSLESIKDIYAYRNTADNPYKGSKLQETDDQLQDYTNIIDICDQSLALADESLFNASKFSHIDIKNLGSWKEEGGWLLGGNTYNADYYHAKFLIHLYVLGEWTVKGDTFAAFEARLPTQVNKPGFLDYVLPDFGLGIVGKIATIILLSLIVVVFMPILFPSLRFIINKLLQLVIGLIMKPWSRPDGRSLSSRGK
jgi:hypothetical protein